MSEYSNMTNLLLDLPNKMQSHYEQDKFAVLKLAIDPNHPSVNVDIVNLYKTHISNHNESVLRDPFPNSGFDLIFLEDNHFQQPFVTHLIDLGVKTEMLYYDRKYECAAFHLLPRSSFSKTPLMQSNHVGVIDSGYRGNLKVPLRFLPEPKLNSYTICAKNKLFQICHPSLCPIYVVLVDESDLSTTSRGTGGFGSTGV